MPFTFPTDSNNKAGAVKPTASGNDFYVPTRSEGSDSFTGNVQNVITSGNRVQLPNIPCREITIIARRTNTGSIFIGGNNVSSSVYGVELQARDSFTFNVSNANLIYIDASVSGEGISYVTI